MSLTERYELNSPPIIAEVVEGEVIAIDLDRGSYYSLASGAADVWVALTTGRSSADILASLPSASELRLAGELQRFIESLLAERLIRLASPDRPAAADHAAGASGAIAAWSEGVLRFERFTDMQDLLILDPIHEVDEEAGWPKPLG
jgi:hypothetical protein